MAKNKTLLLFPDGVGIRNYLYTDIFKNASTQLTLFHAFDEATVNSIKKQTTINEFLRIPKYKESLQEKWLRELICLSRLQYNAKKVDNLSILTNWNPSATNFKNKLFYKTIALASKFIKNYSQILNLERQYQKSIKKTSFYKEITALLKEVQPTQIFCSHQRGIQCAPIFAAAHDLGIKTTTVIYSWDNLPKARMALQADKYLVWSDYMKKEMNTYYPEIKEHQIIVTGTPQFECYDNPNHILPKDVFYETYNLDPTKKIICFSGDDVKTSPDDPQYLQDLAEEVIKNKLESDYQILLRRCPVDVSGRFDAIVNKYSTLIKEAAPLWNFNANSSWTTIYPLQTDVNLLVSTAYYCDIVVNVGSTMAFDFAMFKKPCVYINYDQEKQVNPNWSVETIYQFQHFRSMPSKEAVIWWNNKRNFFTLIEKFNRDYNTENMQNWTKIIIGDKEAASLNISKFLFYDN